MLIPHFLADLAGCSFVPYMVISVYIFPYHLTAGTPLKVKSMHIHENFLFFVYLLRLQTKSFWDFILLKSTIHVLTRARVYIYYTTVLMWYCGVFLSVLVKILRCEWVVVATFVFWYSSSLFEFSKPICWLLPRLVGFFLVYLQLVYLILVTRQKCIIN